jgi:hypothetical protein
MDVQSKADRSPARDVVAALQEKVGTLQQTMKRAVDQISELQRQVSAEQGERNLLSEQIAALAARVRSSSSIKPGMPATVMIPPCIGPRSTVSSMSFKYAFQ